MNRLKQAHTKVDFAREHEDANIYYIIGIIFYIFLSVNDLGSYECYLIAVSSSKRKA